MEKVEEMQVSVGMGTGVGVQLGAQDCHCGRAQIFYNVAAYCALGHTGVKMAKRRAQYTLDEIGRGARKSLSDLETL